MLTIRLTLNTIFPTMIYWIVAMIIAGGNCKNEQTKKILSVKRNRRVTEWSLVVFERLGQRKKRKFRKKSNDFYGYWNVDAKQVLHSFRCVIIIQFTSSFLFLSPLLHFLIPLFHLSFLMRFLVQISDNDGSNNHNECTAFGTDIFFKLIEI